MESQEKLRNYADVNKEIQALIASKENKPYSQPSERYNEPQDIVVLLEKLNKTYTEINQALQIGDSQALKDVILKSDVKMSMVCETLLETLRKTTEEKNKLIREIQGIEKTRRDLENTNINNKVYIEKLRSELDFKKINVDELNRVISDQKSRMAEYKEECGRARSEVQLFKAKIDEIENLRSRSNERMGIYEKELEGLNAIIKDKENTIQMLSIEKKKEEEKNAGVKGRLLELESLVDALNKKLELKDKNTALCNSELSKVLCENKKLKADYEKYKESSGYYEGLYNSLNAQNGYLNGQLNKMLRMNEYSKDVDGSIVKFQHRLKKKKREIKKLRRENERLRKKGSEDSERKDDGTRCGDDTSDFLLKKIEDLNDENEKYKEQVSELEAEKRKLESRMKGVKLVDESVPFKERVRTLLGDERVNRVDRERDRVDRERDRVDRESDRIRPIREELRSNSRIQGIDSRQIDSRQLDSRQLDSRHREVEPYLSFKTYNRPITAWKPPATIGDTYKGGYSRPAEAYPRVETNPRVETYPRVETNPRPVESQLPYLKLFNLDNAYDQIQEYPQDRLSQNKHPPGNDFVGGFVSDSEVPKPKLEMDYGAAVPNRDSVNMNIVDRLFEDKPGGTPQGDNPTGYIPLDNTSVESVKTYHTSSTLKEMMAKTENLKKKFDDLEGKLAQINEGESIDRLTDKIKACNSYYSEWNVESNESDYI